MTGLIFVCGALFVAAPAYAETQPNEKYDQAHCDAAWDADDWVGVSVYCSAEAQDHAVDAADEDGKLYYDDIALEGYCLAEASAGNRHLRNLDTAADQRQKARDLFQKVVAGSQDANQVQRARHMLQVLAE